MANKILVINPSDKTNEYEFCEIPLGAGYIYTAIKHAGFDVSFFDMQKDGFINDVLSLITGGHYNIIAISANTYHYVIVNNLISEIKKIDKSIIIIVGGVHATFKPTDFYDCGADIVIQGPGEIAIIQALNDIISNKHLVSYKMPVDINLCDIDYQYFIMKQYKPITICLSRGCNGNCLFCSSPAFWGKNIQRHSAEWLYKVFEIIAKSNNKDILFVDDNFFASNVFTEDIIDVLQVARSKFNFSFAGNSRIIDYPLDKTSLIKELGFTSISFGIEYIGDDTVYNQKVLSKEYAKEVISSCQNSDIKVRTSWILGLPELKNDINLYNKMIDNIIFLNPDEISLHWLIPFPGSAYSKKKGLFNFVSDYNYNKIPYGLYKYLDNATMDKISTIFYKKLIASGYSDLNSSKKYFYLPTISPVKRSIK